MALIQKQSEAVSGLEVPGMFYLSSFSPSSSQCLLEMGFLTFWPFGSGRSLVG